MQAKEQGISPLEVMLAAMRLAYDQALKQRILSKRVTLMAAAALHAKDAAPYMHPRLTAVAHSGPDKGPIQTLVRMILVDAPERTEETETSADEPK